MILLKHRSHLIAPLLTTLQNLLIAPGRKYRILHCVDSILTIYSLPLASSLNLSVFILSGSFPLLGYGLCHPLCLKHLCPLFFTYWFSSMVAYEVPGMRQALSSQCSEAHGGVIGEPNNHIVMQLKTEVMPWWRKSRRPSLQSGRASLRKGSLSQELIRCSGTGRIGNWGCLPYTPLSAKSPPAVRVKEANW